MKRSVWILSAAVAIILVLFFPVPKGSYDDGGTREYEALTYKLVRWNRMTDDGVYERTRVYWGDDKARTIDELWEEALLIKHVFDAIVFDIADNTVVVEAMPYEQESGLLSFSAAKLDTSGVVPGDIVRVSYVGPIRETSPAQIDVDAWITEVDMSDVPFQGEWIDKARAYPNNSFVFYEPVITAIYADCFFVRTADYSIVKINGTLGGGWCVGDVVELTCENVYYNETQRRTEADLLTIQAGESIAGDTLITDAKPVLYLYPEETTDVDVTLTLDGELTCTYPAYNEGWHVTAAPDGTLTDESGQTYNYLYWEGDTTASFDMSRGFCVKGEDSAVFLEESLKQLGLSRREANEFIVYWLPLMQENPYNLIAFQREAYTDTAELAIAPAPDTLIRVFMAWRASDRFVELEPQTLTAPARIGFTAVEWGGAEIQ